jgi:predicted DNA-binding transcriptional regulator AlpA
VSGLHIVESNPDDIVIDEVAKKVGCSTKTIRRAVQAQQLPRRYVKGARGLELVFRTSEVERWLATRHQRSAALANGAGGLDSLGTPGAPLSLQLREARALLEARQAKVDQLSRGLLEAQQSLDKLSQQLDTLASKLVGVEEILDRVAPIEEEPQAATEEEVPASEG